MYDSKEDFVARYPFDEKNTDSIISNLNRAYDNAIVLRESIGAGQAVLAIMNFLANNDIIKYSAMNEKDIKILCDTELVSVRTEKPGFFEPLVKAGQKVLTGQPMANIINSYEGDIMETLYAPIDSTVFFIHNSPITYANTAVIKLLEG